MPQIEGHGLRPSAVGRRTTRTQAFSSADGQSLVLPFGPTESVDSRHYIESGERWRSFAEVTQDQDQLDVAIVGANGPRLIDRLDLLAAMTRVTLDSRARVVGLMVFIDHLTTARPDRQSMETVTIQDTTLRGGGDGHHQGEEQGRC